MELNQNILGLEDVKLLYDQYSDGARINYSEFMKDVEGFNFDSNMIYEDMNKVQDSKKQDYLEDERYRKYVEKYKLKESEAQFEFMDNKTLPANMIESIYKNTNRTRRFLKNYFPTKKEFDGFIKGALDVDQKPADKTLLNMG